MVDYFWVIIYILTSLGRSNSDTNRNVWTNNGIAANMSGFNWSTNGWVAGDDGKTCLRVGGGASVTIPLQIFSKDFRATGKTIEIEFSARDVSDYNSVIFSCMQAGVGIEITPQSAKMSSSQSTINAKYKENERLRVSFVVDKRSANRLFNTYINGINSQSIQYPGNDSFMQSSPVGITVGSEFATIDLYNIRVYNNNLSRYQLLNNFMADMDDIVKKEFTYNRNQIYNSTGEISFDKVLDYLPCMEIIGDLPQYKGDKKTCKVRYTEKGYPARSWLAEKVVNDVQGTSSQYYPRKNYKFKFDNTLGITYGNGETAQKFQLTEDVLPASVFCTKADFAESSGTHNTGIANYIDYLTKEMDMLTEPQKLNPVVRTTVCGYPICIFHRATEDSEPEFIGKYNFNTDKGAEDTFGFSEGDKSMEFLNNTSELVRFKSSDFTAWQESFEFRYPDGGTDTTEVKKVFDWVVSCKGNTEKFKSELSQFFDKNQLIFYYLITFTLGMVDQRAKNMFLTWYKGGVWLFIFYDNDTCLGINNEGAMSFDPNIEIHDVIGSLNVWNGADSDLWILVENAFPDEIAVMYADIRQKGYLSYDKLMEYFTNHQSDKWSESIYNEDGFFKYEKPLIDGYMDYSQQPPQLIKTGAYLYALQGSREMHRKWWVYNRLFYLDTKFLAGSVRSDFATFRTYTPTDWVGVTPNADITITPFIGMYANIKWGSVTNGKRVEPNVTVTIKAPNMTFNDTETILYGASMIKSLGNLAPLYVGTVDVSKMTRLTELIIGSTVGGYKNTNFTVLSVGSNPLLRKLDIRNCPSYVNPIDVSGCIGVEEIYATGTSTTGVTLAPGGSLKRLSLPGTVTNVTLKNQQFLATSEISLASWEKVNTLIVENSPLIGSLDLVRNSLNSGNTLQYVRLIGIDEKDSDLDTIAALCTKMGIDDNGNYTEVSIVTGKIYVNVITESMLQLANTNFPQLVVTYDSLLPTPTRTIQVKEDPVEEGGTPLPYVGVISVNGVEYTTDSHGSVDIKSSDSFHIIIEEDNNFSGVDINFPSSSYNRTYTLVRKRLFEFTIVPTDILGCLVEGVTIDIPGYPSQKSVLGGTTFRLARGSHAISGSIGGETIESNVNIPEDNFLNLHSFPSSIDKYKVTPNGSILMLVATIGMNQVLSFVVNSSSLDPSNEVLIKWGDGTEEIISTFSNYTLSHTYEKYGNYNIEVTNCKGLSFQHHDDNINNLVALWSIGESANTYSTFGSHGRLRRVGNDVFSNLPLSTTSFSDAFSNTSLEEVPEGLFDQFKEVTLFTNLFRMTNIKSLPKGFFKNNTKVTNADNMLVSCHGITEIPSDIFSYFPVVTSLKMVFSICSIREIPGDLLSNNKLLENASSLFSHTSIRNIPDTLFDNCPNLTNVVGLFSNALNNKDFDGIIPNGLFKNNHMIRYFSSLFECEEGSPYPNKPLKLPANLFDGVKSLLPANDQWDIDRMFANTNLHEIPEGLFKDARNASIQNVFQNCYELNKLPDSFLNEATEVSQCYSTFNHCANLSNLIIPKGVILMSSYYYSSYNTYNKLKYIKAFPVTPPSMYTNSIPDNLPDRIKIYVPDESVEAYKTATNWVTYASRIKPMSEFATDFPS